MRKRKWITALSVTLLSISAFFIYLAIRAYSLPYVHVQGQIHAGMVWAVLGVMVATTGAVLLVLTESVFKEEVLMLGWQQRRASPPKRREKENNKENGGETSE